MKLWENPVKKAYTQFLGRKYMKIVKRVMVFDPCRIQKYNFNRHLGGKKWLRTFDPRVDKTFSFFNELPYRKRHWRLFHIYGIKSYLFLALTFLSALSCMPLVWGLVGMTSFSSSFSFFLDFTGLKEISSIIQLALETSSIYLLGERWFALAGSVELGLFICPRCSSKALCGEYFFLIMYLMNLIASCSPST